MRHFTVLIRLAPIAIGLTSAGVVAAKANDLYTVSERTEAKTGDTGSVTKPAAFAKRATVHERGKGEGHAHVGRSNAAVTVLSEIDAGHIRDLSSRRPVTIHLPGNPSTGYAWNVLRAQNVTVKQPIETVPEPKTPAGVVGAPEITVIHVLPGHPGAASLELGYVGPGQTRPDKVLHYRFTIK